MAKRKRRTGGWLLGASMSTALLLASCGGGGGKALHQTAGSLPTATSKPAATPAPATTSLGPDGIRSTAVVAENNRPGTTAWQISNQGKGTIAGFADRSYAQAGDAVGLYVSTDAASFSVVAYRMGWYQGTGARQVWASATLPGVAQAACPLSPSTNMVSCANWSKSLSLTITNAFPAGDYLLKLTGDRGQQGYIQLVVWDPASTATYLIMNRFLVEQGWNTYGGGYDYYQGKGPCILDQSSYPPCNRARVVSFDRPFDTDGASDFLPNEYPLVQFAEQHGLDVTYCTDICVSEHPDFLLRHKALIGLDHDESWTNSERTGAIAAMKAGVNIAFLGAATLVRHVRLEPSPLGPDRQEVDYRNSAEDPLYGHGDPMEVTGNTWAAAPTSYEASSFTGVIYSGYLHEGATPAPIQVYDSSAWIFKGTGLSNGQTIPAAIGSDIDHIDPAGPIPADLQVMAHSPIPLTEAFTGQGTWNGLTYSDMVYYTDPTSQAGVFSSGDNIWVGNLRPCPAAAGCPAALTAIMTGNIFWLFGQGPAGHIDPSVANWQSVTPRGS